MGEKMTTLYHGSIFEIDHIDVKRGKPSQYYFGTQRAAELLQFAERSAVI